MVMSNSHISFVESSEQISLSMNVVFPSLYHLLAVHFLSLLQLGSQMSPKASCTEGFLDNLWCCWEVVGPGAVDHVGGKLGPWGCALKGDIGTYYF